jgi:hypothetical protein
MNRITHYALALALGLSVVSTAAFAADPSQTQSASAAQAPNVAPTGTTFYSPYDSLSPALSPADVHSAS